MRRTTRPAGRAGFTLIELLIVIAILAILAALVAAGIGKVRDAQQSRVTDQTLTKLHLALNQQWKAVCDQCRDDARSMNSPTPNAQFKAMVTFCDNDKDRAEALWMYLHLRKSIPHTFREARTSVTLAGVTLNASSAFSQVPNVDTGDPNSESAVLLYIILSQGSRGTNFALDDATQGAQMSLALGGSTFPVFKDAFGKPIAFRRFYQNAELNGEPYVRKGLTLTDPLDPVGRLKFWRTQNKTNYDLAKAAVFNTPAQPFGTATDFNGENKVATPISGGADEQFETNLLGQLDDSFGYRVSKQGNKGD